MKKIDLNNFIIDRVFEKLDKKWKKKDKEKKKKDKNISVDEIISESISRSEEPILEEDSCYTIEINV